MFDYISFSNITWLKSKTFSSYLAVNIFRVCYKITRFILLKERQSLFFWVPYKTHFDCWAQNLGFLDVKFGGTQSTRKTLKRLKWLKQFYIILFHIEDRYGWALCSFKSYHLEAIVEWTLKGKSMQFSLADSNVKMWKFAHVSATNSVPIYRLCWWFESTKTDN